MDRVQLNWRDSYNKVREVRNEMDYQPATTSRPDLATFRSRTKTRKIQELSQNVKERRKWNIIIFGLEEVHHENFGFPSVEITDKHWHGIYR